MSDAFINSRPLARAAPGRLLPRHRPRRNYDRTIPFYRDLIVLPVLETFQASYGEDGTIFGLPDSSTHLEIVRATGARRAGKPVRPAGVLPNR
jgi:hypothetical protein